MKTTSSYAAWAMFLMGLFSQTQIHLIGFMDISEAFAYVAGPTFFIIDFQKMRRHGFGKFMFVWFLCLLGAIVSSWINDTPFMNMARGVAVPISVFCLACVFYHFLSIDLKAFRWFFLGAAISMVVCVFVFQRGTDLGRGGGIEAGEVDVESVMEYSLFWLALWGTWITAPVYMFYLRIPKWYSLGVAFWFMFYGFFSAQSRSSLGLTVITILLLILGGKSRKTMELVKKHIATIVLVLIVCAPLIGQFYKYCALQNYLGEGAYNKYMAQTKRGDNMLKLLMSGRSGFFAGLRAAIDKPVFGHGPWARDEKGYYREYVYKYGSQEDVEGVDYYRNKGRVGLIPSHSWVVSFWTSYGILGLICMLYIGWLMVTTIKNRLAVVPELFGYFAFIIPNMIWNWFFSPFGSRTSVTLFFVLCVFVQSIEKGCFQFISDVDTLPWKRKRDQYGLR